jgi:putative solute:sodium symporter small subunit
MPPAPATNPRHDRRALALKAVLLVVLVLVSFGTCFFARELSFSVMGWPLHFWIASQGAVLVFIAILAVYTWAMNRLEARDGEGGGDGPDDGGGGG